MSGFSAAIVTYIDSDVPFQWGLELERIGIPMIIYTSSSYYEELNKYKNPHLSVSCYFTKIFKNTTFEKLLLLEEACSANPFTATHLYWIDAEYIQGRLSFEFLYSNLLNQWLSNRQTGLHLFFQHGHRHDTFFGGEVQLLNSLYRSCDELTLSIFSTQNNASNSVPYFEIVEFDNGGPNNAIAEIVKEPVVHVIGDSHSLYSFTPMKAIGVRNNIFINTKEVSSVRIPYTYQFTHHLGSYTMYTFSKGELITEELLNQWHVKAGDFMLFVLGEIDIRCHVWKEVKEKGRKLNEVTETLVTNYISYLKNLGIIKSANVGIFGVIPPLISENYGPQHKAIQGSIEERIEATVLLNHKLQEEAKKNGMFYCDVYSLYASEKGDLRREMSDLFCHVSHYYKQPGLEHIYTTLNQYMMD